MIPLVLYLKSTGVLDTCLCMGLGVLLLEEGVILPGNLMLEEGVILPGNLMPILWASAGDTTYVHDQNVKLYLAEVLNYFKQ